jgi:hypothetical protein
MRNYSISNLLLSALFVLGCLVAGVSAQPVQAKLVSSNDYSAGGKTPGKYLEQDVMDLINKERKDNGLEPLVWDARTAEVARVHSRDMGWNNFFNHRGQDGKMVNDRADAMGIQDWQMIGENIAMVGASRCRRLDAVTRAPQKYSRSSLERNRDRDLYQLRGNLLFYPGISLEKVDQRLDLYT